MGTLCAFFLFLRVYVPEENDFFVYDVISIGSREIIRKKDCLEMILNHFVTASFLCYNKFLKEVRLWHMFPHI